MKDKLCLPSISKESSGIQAWQWNRALEYDQAICILTEATPVDSDL